jgi:hypothetical protein
MPMPLPLARREGASISLLALLATISVGIAPRLPQRR